MWCPHDFLVFLTAPFFWLLACGSGGDQLLGLGFCSGISDVACLSYILLKTFVGPCVVKSISVQWESSWHPHCFTSVPWIWCLSSCCRPPFWRMLAIHEVIAARLPKVGLSVSVFSSLGLVHHAGAGWMVSWPGGPTLLLFSWCSNPHLGVDLGLTLCSGRSLWPYHPTIFGFGLLWESYSRSCCSSLRLCLFWVEFGGLWGRLLVWQAPWSLGPPM